jgi:glycerol uptake facilitator protein
MHAAAPNQPERTPKTYTFNFFTEIIATFALVLAVSAATFYTSGAAGEQGTAASTAAKLLPGALIAALVVIGIGLGLGGPTGYTINPTRDLAPRLVHQILKVTFPAKGKSD